ncbi:MAG: phosphate regulon sensor histidine kinase PhoR [Gammaproteobacteria bacterium]|nr:MAG: phosphate regulon sensor histidine kinase PhoR [Gammaproteobacteria bacterium]
MQSSWLTELQRLFLALLFFAVVGGLFGRPFLGVSLVLLGYTLWTLWHMRRLEQWLAAGGEEETPDSSGFWGVLFDAVDRLRRRQRQTQERWQSAYEHVQESFRALSDAVVMINSQGMIDWMNPASRRLLGFDPRRDRGTQLTNLLRDPVFIAYFDAADFSEPLDLLSPVDHRIKLEVQLTVFGEGNRLMFARDVTRLQQLEQMRKDFVANVSHELKTPLTVISGYLETLSQAGVITEPRWQKAIEQMHAQSERMRHLVDDLLLLSRLESLPRAMNEPVALATLLREVANEVAAAFPGRYIPVDCDESLVLLGNAAELHSVFLNLLSNACKYTPLEKPVLIGVSVAGQGVDVSVIDEGAGIDRKHLPRLTERFYRVDDSRFTETGGTGLGLAIVKHALMRHDAQLLIDSEPGKGSRFTCRFPASRLHA